MAAAAAVDTPGTYVLHCTDFAVVDPPAHLSRRLRFVGAPLHYQEPAPAPAVDEQNAVNAQIPGYYAGPVQGRQDPAAEHKCTATDTAPQQSQEQGFLARWLGCFTGRSGNAN